MKSPGDPIPALLLQKTINASGQFKTKNDRFCQRPPVITAIRLQVEQIPEKLTSDMKRFRIRLIPKPTPDIPASNLV